jgi:hypothetical protein
VVLRDNVIFNFRPIGVNMITVRNITYDRNVLVHIVGRTTFESTEIADFMGGVLVCSLPITECYDTTVTNNIVAGVIWAGFVTMGHDCGDYDATTFKGNVAHSNKFKTKGGYGALIYPDPTRPAQV